MIGKGDKDLMDGLEKLLALKTDNTFIAFEKFFAEVQDLLSPLFEFSHFKAMIVRHLAPIAPYLERF